MKFELPTDIQKEKMPWIKGRISIKAPDFITFLERYQNKGGWVNIDMKKSDNTGNIYLELNTWKPTPKEVEIQTEPLIDPKDGRDITPTEDIPF